MCKNYLTSLNYYLKILIAKSIIIFSILFLNNCQWFIAADTTFLYGTDIKIPDGTPIFKEGFRDGCETVLNSRGNTFYRTRYDGFRFNPDYIRNSEYKFAVSRGYGFCFNYILRFVNSGSDDYIVSPSHFDWTLGSIDDTRYEKGKDIGFGTDQSMIKENIFEDIFWWTKTKDGKGGGAMSENIFYGTNYGYFGSFSLPDGSFGHTDSGISARPFGDHSPFGGPYRPFGD
jgi:hypothetical protein